MREPVKATCSVRVTHGEEFAVVPQFQGITCGSSVLGRRTVPGGLVLEDTGFPFTWRVRRYAAGPWGRRACPWATDDVCDTGGFPANTNTRFSPHSCNPRCFLAPSGSTTHGWACRMRPTHPLGTSPECRLTKSRVLFRLSASERPNSISEGLISLNLRIPRFFKNRSSYRLFRIIRYPLK